MWSYSLDTKLSVCEFLSQFEMLETRKMSWLSIIAVFVQALLVPGQGERLVVSNSRVASLLEVGSQLPVQVSSLVRTCRLRFSRKKQCRLTV